MEDQQPDDKILHQTATEQVIEDHTEATSDHAAIADLASPSTTYVQAEAVAARGKINEILDVLRDANLIPSA